MPQTRTSRLEGAVINLLLVIDGMTHLSPDKALAAEAIVKDAKTLLSKKWKQ